MNEQKGSWKPGEWMLLDEGKLHRVQGLLEREIEAGRIPGAVIAIGIGGELVVRRAFGFAENRHGVTRELNPETLFDLASLTKVVATLPAVLSLVEDGILRLTDPVSRYIGSFNAGAANQVTISHLLTHTSGLPSHRPYYLEFNSEAEIRQALRRELVETSPGSRVVYSDVGFMLLGELISEVTDLSLPEYVEKRIFLPLNMRDTGYLPDASHNEIAATEDVPGYGVKVGLVHDENTAALGGIAGHAGVFAPVDDLVRYVQMWLGKSGEVLSPAVRRLAVQCHTESLNGRRGLGWVKRYDDYDCTGDLWPTSSVSHTGYTGTSMAFDPESKLWVILLTNDVHYGREMRAILRVRGLVHNLVAAAVRD